MSSSREPPPLCQQPDDTVSFYPEQVECTVKSLTGKFFLNRPVEELLPAQYLRKAKQTSAVQRKAWIFRNGNRDGRAVDVSNWSKVDIRYRGVFTTLAKCPEFAAGLWEGGTELCQGALDNGRPKAQGHVIYALLEEIGDVLNLQRRTMDPKAVFALTPRLIETQMEYWTGYREKHKDGPVTAGFLSVEFRPNVFSPQLLLPVSTAMEEGTLVSCLEGKFKLMLGQLLHHMRPLSVPGDKLPDQEIFLIGLHGSKLHLMRAFFPGQKISSLWCQRELPSPSLAATVPTAQWFPPTDTPHSSHIETYYPGVSTEQTHEETSEEDPDITSHRIRFHTPENVDQHHQHLQETQLQRLDHEPDLRTFRILATQEYDLWLEDEFSAAVQLLVALHLYLLSGNAQCGALQEIFLRHPHHLGDTDEPDDPDESADELEARLRDDARKEQMAIEAREEQLRREELIRREEDARASRVRDSMRFLQTDRISSLRDARQHWWDFVWKDSEESLLPAGKGDSDSEGDEDEDENGDGDGEDGSGMIVGNLL